MIKVEQANNIIWVKSVSIIGLILLLNACTSNIVASSDSIRLESAKAAQEASFTPQQAISQAKAQLDKAKTDKLDFYAPLHIMQAKESISEANTYLLNPPKEIKNAALMSAIAAQRFITDAYINKETVKTSLNKSLVHLQILKDLKSPSLLRDDFNSVSDGISDLIIMIEEGKLTKAIKEQKNLLDEMALVEIQTLKLTYLSLATNFLSKAEQINAEKYAAESYVQAESAINSANKYIDKNYRNRKGVKKISDEAILKAKRAYFIGLEAKKAVLLSPEEAENYILNLYAHLDSINIKGTGKKLEPQDFSTATQQLTFLIGQLKQQIKDDKRALQEAKKLKLSKPIVSDQTKKDLNSLPEEEKLEIQTLPSANNSKSTSVDHTKSSQKTDDSGIPLQEDEQSFDDFEKMEAF